MPLLWIEFDPGAASGLHRHLEALGWRIEVATDPAAPLQALRYPRHAAFVFDVGDGRDAAFGLLRHAWRAGRPPPILLVTTRQGVDERVAWLDAGADRCLCHPVDARELAARLRALIRAQRPPSMQRLTLGDLLLDPALRSAALGGVPLSLSDREFDLLACLVRQPEQPLPRAALEQALYAGGRPVSSNAVEVHVHHLRRKLGPGRLLTVRGMGYVLRPPVDPG